MTTPDQPPKFCFMCDAPIPAKRLAAMPDAKFCILCQLAFDKPIHPDDLGEALAAPGEIRPSEVLP